MFFSGRIFSDDDDFVNQVSKKGGSSVVISMVLGLSRPYAVL